MILRGCFSNVFTANSIQAFTPSGISLLLSAPKQAFNNAIISKRHTSFMNQVSASEVWAGATGVSNAGKKKGRGRRVGRKKITDLNKGQHLGSGRDNMKWPGLNSPVIVDHKLVQQTKLPADPHRFQAISLLRDQSSKVKYQRLGPLERGFSGPYMAGRSIGPPQPINDYIFEGFDSKVLEQKMVTNMTSSQGRKRRISIFIVTGNKNGVAGFGLGKATSQHAAMRMALNRASQKLVYIPRFEDHTVYHNMWSQFQRSKIFIHKKQKGFGLRCHRVLKAICETIGISDLHCKVENSTTNVQSITKAFFNALINQETHAELAERMGYHLVEMKKEEELRPRVLASATNIKEQPIRDEFEDLEMDFERLYYGGRCELQRASVSGYDLSNKHHVRALKKKVAARNQPQAAILRAAGLT